MTKLLREAANTWFVASCFLIAIQGRYASRQFSRPLPWWSVRVPDNPYLRLAIFVTSAIALACWLLWQLWWLPLRTALRRAARLDGAREDVRSLREHIASFGMARPLVGSARLQAAAELNGIIDALRQHGFLKASGVPARTSLERMQEMMADEAATPIVLAAALEGFERRLEAERQFELAGRMSAWLFDRKRETTAPVQPPVSSDFTPDESALLAGITEKFYGSASFKALGIALVAAVLLAGSGVVLIGTHALNLQDNLDKTAKSQEESLTRAGQKQLASLTVITDEITKRGSDMKTQLDAQSKLVNQQAEDFARQQKTFGERHDAFVAYIADKQREVDQKVHDFEQDAIKSVLQTVQKELEGKADTLAKGFDDATKVARQQLDARIVAIASDAVSSDDKLTKLNGQVQSLTERTTALGLRLDDVQRQGGSASDILGQLNHLHDVTQKAEAERDHAATAAAMAQQKATDASDLAVAVGTTLDDVRRRTDARQRDLGVVEGKLAVAQQTAAQLVDGLNQRMAAARDAADHAIATITNAAAAHQRQLDMHAGTLAAGLDAAAGGHREMLARHVAAADDAIGKTQTASKALDETVQELDRRVAGTRGRLDEIERQTGTASDIARLLGDLKGAVHDIDADKAAAAAAADAAKQSAIAAGQVIADAKSRLDDLVRQSQDFAAVIDGKVALAVQQAIAKLKLDQPNPGTRPTPAAQTDLQKGDIRLVQVLLNGMKLYAGAIDGIIGPKMLEALNRFRDTTVAHLLEGGLQTAAAPQVKS